MATLRWRSWVAAPAEVVFAFFDDPHNLQRLMPPPATILVERIDPAPPQAGSVFTFRYGVGPFQRAWTVRLLERVANERFVDETISGPLAVFRHSHVFVPAHPGTWIVDRVEYRVGPGGGIGLVVDWLAGWLMRGTFIWRGLRQRQLLR